MKRFNLVLSIMFIAFTAQAQLSQFDLASFNQEPFNLIWNGQEIASRVSQISVTELEAGLHQIQIVRQKQMQTAYGYPLTQMQTVFNGSITISPNTLVVALLQNNQMIIQNQTALIPQYSNAYGGGNYNYQGNHQPPYGNGPNHHPYNNNYYNGPGNYPGHIPVCNQAPLFDELYHGPLEMDAASFHQLKNSINNQWFSSGQLNVFEQALNSNFFTAQQVNELVQLFTFSSDKLKVAKMAYTKTIDPENYFVVNNSLEFSSSVNALSNYIASL